MSDPTPLHAFVGYRWLDGPSAELLHEELAVRGMTVLHDRCTFDLGWRMDEAMEHAVEICDGYVPLLTPSSLYTTEPDGAPRPAIDHEFIPIFRRRAASAAAGERPARPAIALVTRDLGDPRKEAPTAIKDATGEDVSDIWSIGVSQDGDALSYDDAAAIAHGLLDALLAPGTGPALDAVPLTVATRGNGETPAFLVVDATMNLGGPERRTGEPEAWRRLLAGLLSVAHIVTRWTPTRALKLNAKAHLSACVAVGRVFNQAAGWSLTLTSDRLTVADHPDEDPEIEATEEAKGGALVVTIDMLGHQVSDLADPVIDTLGPVGGRVHVQATEAMQLSDRSAGDLVRAAAATAAQIRKLTSAVRPDTIHVFMTAPAAYAVHLGARLTALSANVHLYERDDDRYVHVLELPHNLP